MLAGLPLETPFGVIYSTKHHIRRRDRDRRVVLPAFERAMREGIHRDGKHLYPAFPYTHFAKTSDADLQALYAYLMAQAPVRAENKTKRTRVPLQHPSAAGQLERAIPSTQTVPGDATKSRGVEIAAPIWSKASAIAGACPFAAQRAGCGKAKRLPRGRFADGWEAPALTSLSQAPIP